MQLATSTGDCGVSQWLASLASSAMMPPYLEDFGTGLSKTNHCVRRIQHVVVEQDIDGRFVVSLGNINLHGMKLRSALV